MNKTALLLATAIALSPSASWGKEESADARARNTEAAMTAAERENLLHGIMALPVIPGTIIPPDAVIGAGYVEGVSRLGVPSLKESDASLGVAWVSGMRKDGATALPSATAMGAGFDPALVRDASAMIAAEARAKGFNILLAGGINLMRDPRNGRTFEYFAEDPLLSGILGAAAVEGVQSQRVIATVKHFALNAQETGRQVIDVKIGEAAARESDLLAFELAIEKGKPGSVMCAYNKVRGRHACDSEYLLSDVLKRDWRYPGFVMSDWGAVPGVSAMAAGLDQQSGSQTDKQVWFGKPLIDAASADPALQARISDANRRILRSIYAVGLDQPAPAVKIDQAANNALAQRVAERGIVLLRNERNALPLAAKAKTIAVIGGYADMGVMSGGGSSQVHGVDGPAATIPMGGEGPFAFLHSINLHRSPPLAAIRKRAAGAKILYDDGHYIAEAARTAAKADVVILFASQWMMEGYDVPDLSLPDNQDALIAAVAAANPNTVVVLETGGPVLMPWLDKTAAVIEAWYPGAQGGEAIARVLFGEVNPSGKLPISFPASVEQLPRPAIPGWDELDKSFEGTGNEAKKVTVDYDIEGADIGYRWYARKNIKPLFPFGYGLSYTSFAYEKISLRGGNLPSAQVTVRNSGAVAGDEVVALYAVAGPNDPGQRLVGFTRVSLKPGETKRIDVAIEPKLLARWDEAGHRWQIAAGRYELATGPSSDKLTAKASLTLNARTIAQ
ncbi:beta-glucosidase [Sphingobium sp. Leaf26]|uniref:beta-glucosidase n=1 Tax=Sphingobium sp. Leaf26 TaxID=1735693 RepID=UPI0006FC3800|nr:glycoside hydrolase family 3 C-terminal domain-containing protein [Sphingobium sp. Leaf26]KQM99196.1 beta-glucosidase [Sphingobium sp. Leaf26]